MNLGQLRMLLRAEYLVDAIGYNQVNGLPIKAADLSAVIADLVEEVEGTSLDLDASVERNHA
jgi:2-oxoglutarate ferredoxin oxidoreductase subunit alpha